MDNLLSKMQGDEMQQEDTQPQMNQASMGKSPLLAMILKMLGQKDAMTPNVQLTDQLNQIDQQ